MPDSSISLNATQTDHNPQVNHKPATFSGKEIQSISDHMNIGRIKDVAQGLAKGKLAAIFSKLLAIRTSKSKYTVATQKTAEKLIKRLQKASEAPKEPQTAKDMVQESKDLVREMIAINKANNNQFDTLEAHTKLLKTLNCKYENDRTSATLKDDDNISLSFITMPNGETEVSVTAQDGETIILYTEKLYKELEANRAEVNRETGEVKFQGKTYYFPAINQNTPPFQERVDNLKLVLGSNDFKDYKNLSFDDLPENEAQFQKLLEKLKDCEANFDGGDSDIGSYIDTYRFLTLKKLYSDSNVKFEMPKDDVIENLIPEELSNDPNAQDIYKETIKKALTDLGKRTDLNMHIKGCVCEAFLKEMELNRQYETQKFIENKDPDTLLHLFNFGLDNYIHQYYDIATEDAKNQLDDAAKATKKHIEDRIYKACSIDINNVPSYKQYEQYLVEESIDIINKQIDSIITDSTLTTEEKGTIINALKEESFQGSPVIMKEKLSSELDKALYINSNAQNEILYIKNKAVHGEKFTNVIQQLIDADGYGLSYFDKRLKYMRSLGLDFDKFFIPQDFDTKDCYAKTMVTIKDVKDIKACLSEIYNILGSTKPTAINNTIISNAIINKEEGIVKIGLRRSRYELPGLRESQQDLNIDDVQSLLEQLYLINDDLIGELSTNSNLTQEQQERIKTLLNKIQEINYEIPTIPTRVSLRPGIKNTLREAFYDKNITFQMPDPNQVSIPDYLIGYENASNNYQEALKVTLNKLQDRDDLNMHDKGSYI